MSVELFNVVVMVSAMVLMGGATVVSGWHHRAPVRGDERETLVADERLT